MMMMLVIQSLNHKNLKPLPNILISHQQVKIIVIPTLKKANSVNLRKSMV